MDITSLESGLEVFSDLNPEFVEEIKYVTAKRLELVNQQLSNLMNTATNIERRGYDVEAECGDRAEFLFALRSELVQKKKELEEKLVDKTRVDNEELSFYLKLQDED